MAKSNKVSQLPDNRKTRADLTQGDSALIEKVLVDPSLFPDEFRAWLPRWIMQNVNFKVQQEQLPGLEAVRVVGASGQPAFQNSWVAYGGSDDVPGFYKDPWGIVHLTGTVKNGTLNTTVFTLPAGYRPQYINNFAVVCDSAFGQININTVGDVAQTACASTGYLTLSSISFRAYS